MDFRLLWFLIGLFFIVGELFIPSLTVLPFGLGAWFTLAGSWLFTLGLASQIICFITSSLVFLWLFKAIVKAGKNNKKQYGVDTLVGSYGITKTALYPSQILGKVEVHGSLWNAESFEEIPEGKRVVIVAQDNLTLTVQAID